MAEERALVQIIERMTDRFYGKYRGTVTDNQDPLMIGRLKAQVPEVLHDTDTGWALPCAPYAGDGAGLFAVPAAGAGVWIEFEAGDPSRPIWSGTWWSANEVPKDEAGTPTLPARKIWRTEQGLLLSMDDTAQTITLSDGNGTNLVTIKVMESTVEVRGTAKVVLEAPLINHGQGAAHPAVFGDSLLTYLNQLVMTFNTHVHPGELALGVLPVTPTPPVTPFPPAQPSLLSTKNLVE